MIASAYEWWKFLHILGGFGFVAAHGATSAVAARVRSSEREPVRIRALLDLSRATRSWMYVSLLVLLVAGIVTGFSPGISGSWRGQGWIWTAIALLVVMTVAAFVLAVPYYAKVRHAVAEGSGATASELDELLRSARPLVIFCIETAGVVAIVWLMVLKPF